MTHYFRITAYHPEKDICAIFDSNGKFEKLWQFSSYLIHKGYRVLCVHSVERFEEGNLPCIQKHSDKIIVRACMKGQIKAVDGKITINGKFYFPNEQT